MKKQLLIIFLFLRLIAHGQADFLARAIAYNISPVGKSTGEKTIKSIGSEGGRIRSSDGIVELIIPAGAMETATDISLQSTDNTALAGIGSSYNFGPDGLQFKVPAELVFHYADSDNKQTPALFQNIVWQDGQGQWHHLEKLRLDSVHKTISGAISHFTGYARQSAIYIKPSSKELNANDYWSFSLGTGDQLPDRYKGMTGQQLWDAEKGEQNISWYVNALEGGSAEYGRCSYSSYNGRWSVDYTAPNIIPDINPVTLEARLSGPFTLANGAVVSSLSAYALVTVVDRYRYTFVGYTSMGKLHMIDSSSCIIKLRGARGSDVSLEDITNYPAWSDWPEGMDKCYYWYTNKDTWKGLVDIAGAATHTAEPRTSDQPFVFSNNVVSYHPHYTHVYIGLKPSTGNTPSARVKCKDGWRNVPSESMPAQPTYIDLTIDPETVQISYAGKTSSGELNAIINKQGFIIRVKRIKPGLQ